MTTLHHSAAWRRQSTADFRATGSLSAVQRQSDTEVASVVRGSFAGDHVFRSSVNQARAADFRATGSPSAEQRQSNTEPVAWAGVQVVLLAVLEGTVGLGVLGWLAGIAYAVANQALLSGAVQRSSRGALGPADRVTVVRGLLVGGVTALVADGGHQPALLVVAAAVALALDFVDGQVARRTGTASAMGARFDMEVDAFLILVLSVHVALTLGPWVMVIGALRYAFVVASWGLAWLREPLPPSQARKVVAAVQGIALVVAASGLLPHADVLVGLALVSLVWSFGRDIAWLWRNAPASVEGISHG